jgi:hypothetical protein
MAKRTLFSLATLGVFGFASLALSSQPTALVSQQPSVVECRHTRTAAQEDRTRRDQAMSLAKAINHAEAEAVKRTKRYQPLANLGKLPMVPRGFELKLFANSSGYLFVLKDTLDPCRYAVFSDESGFVYEKAMDAPLVAQP